MIITDPVTTWKGVDVLIYGPSYVSDNVKIGASTKIGAFSDISSGVTIGEKCNIQCHTAISTGVAIGDRVFLGPRVTILNDLYPVSKKLAPPVIEDDAILCGSCTINPGVTIGHKAVVCSGALVTKKVPAGMVFMSKTLPATFHCFREAYDEKREEYEK